MIKLLWESIKKPIFRENPNFKLDLEELNLNLQIAINKSVLMNAKENQGFIALTLSGGLDSSYCLAIIAQALENEIPIHTITVGNCPEHPDIQFARLMAEQCQTIHHEIIASPEEILAAKSSCQKLWGESRDGDAAVWLAYQKAAELGFKAIIAHDGIDELLGGYWDHRKHDDPNQKLAVFQNYWQRLEAGHLIPLMNKAEHFGIKVQLPYLDGYLVDFINQIPLDERSSREMSKIPLRQIAACYLPKEIIARQKYGFCNALKAERS